MHLSELDQKWLAEIENTVEYVSLIDADDNLLYVNRMTDSLEAIRGVSVYEFIDAAYHAALREAVVKARQSGVPQHYDSYAVNEREERSSYSNWVITLNTPSADGIVAFIATDVTQLSRVAEELELSESMLQSMVENSPDTIFVLDSERTIRFASKMEHGFDTAQVIGQKADLFIPESELLEAIELFEDVLTHHVVKSYEASIQTPLGERTFNARLAPMSVSAHNDLVMIVVTDITETRKSEVAQLQLREQLQQSQKMEAIGQLTGGVAHDFNNLLLTISGNLELVMSSPGASDTQAKYINEALNGVERARDLTRRLLAFSRKQPLQPEALDIGDLVENMHMLLRRTLSENVSIDMDTGQARGHVSQVDRAQLENAILNLALNARDAMPEGGELQVLARWVPATDVHDIVAQLGCVRISVKDDGIGMDEWTTAHAVDPFFTTKEVGEGSGLGLSMVFGFVQQSHGAIRIHSQLGEGTTVEIDLPCVEAAAEKNINPGLPLQTPTGKGELILVVEDDDSVRDVTALLLNRLGYKTLSAQNGSLAIQALADNQDIQLIITDVVMPGTMSGFELADRFRELRPDIPVMLVSGHPLDKRAAQYGEQRLGALLQKPYRSDELAIFVSKMLNSPESL